jgi:hypothetical protein
MAARLHRGGYEHARALIAQRRVTLDERDEWSEHQPSAEEENRYIEEHGIAAFGKWFLGVDDELGSDAKGHYKYPYGDFETVHRCAILSAESRAGQYDHDDIRSAAAHLHGMLEATAVQGPPARG